MIRFLRWTSLLATLGLTSTFEFQAGIAAGLDWWLAALLPLAIDTYVMSALLQGWDRLPALLILEAAVAAGATHAHYGDPAKLGVSLALGTIITAVLWRVDSLFHRAEKARLRAERLAAQQEATAAAERVAAERRAREEEWAAQERQRVADLAHAEAEARRAEAEAAAAEASAAAAIAQAKLQQATPPPPPAPPASGKQATSAAPSREAARQILMALDDFEAVSNADLARRHGGTDTYWRLRKNDLRAELAALGAEASTL